MEPITPSQSLDNALEALLLSLHEEQKICKEKNKINYQISSSTQTLGLSLTHSPHEPKQLPQSHSSRGT